MAEQPEFVQYQVVRGTDIKSRYRVVAQNVPKFAEQTFYGTVLARNDLNNNQSQLDLMWDGFDDAETVAVNWIEPNQYDPEKAIMALAPLYRAKAEPKVRAAGLLLLWWWWQGVCGTVVTPLFVPCSLERSLICQNTPTVSGTRARTSSSPCAWWAVCQHTPCGHVSVLGDGWGLGLSFSDTQRLFQRHKHTALLS